MTSTASPRVTSTEETRSRITEAAIRLFANHGYDGTSVREIAEAAGVTKPVLYYHFGSKERLYVAMIEECYARCRTHITRVTRRGRPFRDQLRELVAAHFAYFAREENTARMLYTVAFAPQRNSPKVDLRELEQPHLELLASIIRDGIQMGEVRPVPVLDAAVLLLGMLNIHLMGQVVVGDRPGAADVNQIVSIFADGVAAR